MAKQKLERVSENYFHTQFNQVRPNYRKLVNDKKRKKISRLKHTDKTIKNSEKRIKDNWDKMKSHKPVIINLKGEKRENRTEAILEKKWLRIFLNRRKTSSQRVKKHLYTQSGINVK